MSCAAQRDGSSRRSKSRVLAERDGNRLDVERLAGAVVRSGRELEVHTQLNRAIHAALGLHASGGAS